jgi:hypothetical protein
MHPRQICIALAALGAFAGQAAVVYKWTDANGVVHYSDQPIPGAEKIVTAGNSKASSTQGPAQNPGQGQGQGGPGARKPGPPGGGLNYAQFAITSPASGQTFFGDDIVAVHLDLEPNIKPNQIITWHLNGKELEDQGPATTQFTLPHLDRGTYALAATITDQATGESQSTASVSFFVRQPSELAPLHQRP